MEMDLKDWTKTKDRLPESGRYVLVAGVDSDDYYRIDIAKYNTWYDVEEIRWRYNTNLVWTDFRTAEGYCPREIALDYTPTYWTDLPLCPNYIADKEAEEEPCVVSYGTR